MLTNWRHHHEREETMNCQEMEELLGAYALGALSEEERIAADAHLAECPKCTNTLQQLRAIVDLFPLSVPAIDPSPRLKAQILARIQEEEAARQSAIALPVMPNAPRQARQRNPRRNWRTALLAATTLLLLILVGASFAWNLSLRQQVAQLSAQPTQSTQSVSPVVYSLHGTGANAAASGQLIYYAQQNITVLVMRNLPQISGTQVYQGWLLQGNKPTSIGLLNVQNGVATLDFQGTISGYDAAAVSLEHGPQATSTAPRGPVVALGTLKKA
jgi:anti-sigma-K factor RskA